MGHQLAFDYLGECAPGYRVVGQECGVTLRSCSWCGAFEQATPNAHMLPRWPHQPKLVDGEMQPCPFGSAK